jgi:HEAT repeat protein
MFGTLKDVVEPKRFEFGLMVQTVERDAQQRGKEEQQVERLSVLEGLRKYASEHVLLVGRPGSGKSTALVRLLMATAQQARQNPHSQIPVLVELRTYNIYYKTSVLDLVRASLKRRKLRLDIETIEELLVEGRFLLLMDGINELPDDEARNHIRAFRLDYSDVPMVFATRDLGVGGDLGIERKLEMQSLTEAEVEKFVRDCMPGGSQHTLQQLRQRLRELGQTPFVMWMLYFIVEKTGKVPSGAGSAFREFTQLYERRSKDDAPVSDESRRWWSRLLEHLGFEMMQADKPTDLRLTISKREAEDILTKVLDREKFDKPRDRALQWLEDLLKHHLIQVTSNDQIEFCHQLIQEYYAAEILLQKLLQKPSPLNDETLKREYLNYLKWTEPLALMLELVEDEVQAVRVVKLALEVDWWLGARLAGAVQPQFQEQTVDLVAGLEIPQLVKIQVLGLTKSEKAIPLLMKGLEDEDAGVRGNVANALGEIGSETTISSIIQLLGDEDYFIHNNASEALCRISSQATIPTLFHLLEDKSYFVRISAVKALDYVNSETAIYQVFQSPSYQDRFVRGTLAFCLRRINSEAAISRLVQLLQDEDYFVSRSASEAMGEINSESAIPKLIQLLEHKNSLVRSSAAHALGNIGSDAATIKLIKLLEDEDYFVCSSAIIALGKIASEKAIPKLLQLLEYKDSFITSDVIEALGHIGSEAVISNLVQLLEHDNYFIRSQSADALGKIGSEAAIPKLVQLLKDEAPFVRSTSARVLSKIGGEAMIPRLIQLLEDKVYTVRAGVAGALGTNVSEIVVIKLIQLLEDENSAVRRNVSYALGEIGSENAIHSLIKLLKDRAGDVRESAAVILGKIGSLEVVNYLTKLLEDEDFVADDFGNTRNWLINSLQSIQKRCKLYNPTLTQSPQMEDKPKSEVKRDQVFISYSHKDKKSLEKLQTMLKPMMRNDTILVWDDTKIQAGAKWRDEIEKALARANVAVLMVSANFLASDFIAKQELPPLLNAAAQEGLKIIWVPVGYCLYEETEIEQYQAVHNPSQPLESLKGAKLNEVLAKICREIKAATTATT